MRKNPLKIIVRNVNVYSIINMYNVGVRGVLSARNLKRHVVYSRRVRHNLQVTAYQYTAAAEAGNHRSLPGDISSVHA